ncbi:hypothetical protein B0J13DRAFT_625619 [Dactylonectria estremocensis]|uniref:Uncharacterized protein n=1 Tax=Dactylonectria estremocensis TaxID=1079267 RepID=A0A9P9EH55_9HYPO|nr:hypothetical protein B0J13DRAFT_625619 [Dactylonectria estremocensis]
MPLLVGIGDAIYVDARSFDNKVVNVTWKQDYGELSENYIPMKYRVTSGGSSEGSIFIQANKLPDFRRKHNGGTYVTVIVDSQFQYGQDKDHIKRFLVYHDKGHRPYQHRFAHSVLTTIGDKAVEFAASLGYSDVGKLRDALSGYLGDYLRDFPVASRSDLG